MGASWLVVKRVIVAKFSVMARFKPLLSGYGIWNRKTGKPIAYVLRTSPIEARISKFFIVTKPSNSVMARFRRANHWKAPTEQYSGSSA
jgi:hypothetical protein